MKLLDVRLQADSEGGMRGSWSEVPLRGLGLARSSGPPGVMQLPDLQHIAALYCPVVFAINTALTAATKLLPLPL